MLELAALDQRSETGRRLVPGHALPGLPLERDGASVRLTRVQHRHASPATQHPAQFVCQLDQRHVVAERVERQRHRPPAPRRDHAAALQLGSERSRQAERELRFGAKQRLEVRPRDLQQLGVPQRAHRGVAARVTEQRELSEHRAASDRVDRFGLGALADHLELPETHDIDAVGAIVFAEQPLVSLQADGARELCDLGPHRVRERREHRHVQEELGDRLLCDDGLLAMRVRQPRKAAIVEHLALDQCPSRLLQTLSCLVG